MITVRLPDSFLPERTYIVNTLLHHFLDLDISIIPDRNATHYVLEYGGRSVVIEDHFFGKIETGESYLHEELLPDAVIETNSPALDKMVLLYGRDYHFQDEQQTVCGVDLFAAAYFMLTRWEEYVSDARDRHDRFPAGEARIVDAGFILRPVVDEYIAWLKKTLTRLGAPMPPEKRSYTAVPSCDVDIPWFWSGRPAWRALMGRMKSHWNPFQLWRDYQQCRRVRKGLEKDPYDQYAFMMDVAERAGVLMQFNFIAGGETAFERFYHIEDNRIQSLIESIKKRGHLIGLHPSYASATDANIIATEKAALENVSGLEIRSSRQHFLRFTVPDTWRALAAAGIRLDSSLGYAAEPGFRCGTSHPYPVFDFLTRQELNILEQPLLVMDVSLRFYLNKNVEESLAICQEIIQQVKKHRGEFVLLWHNSNLSIIDAWHGWRRLFESVLSAGPSAKDSVG